VDRQARASHHPRQLAKYGFVKHGFVKHGLVKHGLVKHAEVGDNPEHP
jgi:hypothetical protein